MIQSIILYDLVLEEIVSIYLSNFEQGSENGLMMRKSNWVLLRE